MRFFRILSIVLAAFGLVLAAQEQPAAEAPKAAADTPKAAADAGWRAAADSKPGEYVVAPGTRIPLSLINSVSTKHSTEGDRVYLETVFPILVNGKVVIPPGSYVAGTITQVKRPGRIKGRGEFYLRFDSLTLPNGVTRDFRARIGSLDGRASEELDKGEGKVKSEGNKAGDARTVGEAAATGASVGVIAGGAAGGHYGMGAGIGAAAGAAAGVMAVLLTRGPEAVLAKGSTLEMVLDRPVTFDDADLNFANAMQRAPGADGGGPLPSQKHQSLPMPGRRWPI